MIPYGRQHISQDDVKAVQKVLMSDFLTQGPKIKEFEKALCQYTGAKYAVAVTNGTAALHLAYLVANIGDGDEVITTPNTFVATTNMLLAVGAKPVFCDIRLDTYNIDESEIEKLITTKTRAIVAVHFAGQPCAMRKILKLAKKHKLAVIEDAAHALGAGYGDKKIGGLNSDMATLSFHPVKSITTGEGGAVLTNNQNYYKKLILLRSHGIKKDARGFNVMTELGYNYRLTDIQAALGISQLKKIDSFMVRRRRVAEWYREELIDIRGIFLPSASAESAWHIYVVRVKNEKLRILLMEYLNKNGIATNFHYPAVYGHPYYKEQGFDRIHLKNMEEYQKTCVTIPCYPQLTHREVKIISDKIKNFLADT